MEITAKVLFNYLRCPRYAALNYPDVDVLNKEKYFEARDEYHQILKDILLNILKKKHDEIIVNFDISYDFHPEIKLVESVDFYIETNKQAYLYSITANTSSEFMKMTFKLGKHRYRLFKKNSSGIYDIRRDKLSETDAKHYFNQIKKLLDRHQDVGKIVYKYAYKNFIYNKAFPDRDFKHYYIMLNSDYVYNGLAYQKNMFHFFDFSALQPRYDEIIEVDLYRIINHIELNDFTPCLLVKKECQYQGKDPCDFVDFCYSHFPKENSILDYFQSHLGFDEQTDDYEIHHDVYDLINEGIVDMLDVPISWLKSEKHLMQRYCVEANYTHINKPKVKAILATLKYPLIYLDFEAFPCLLPRFKGETPYTQSVFQYSVHVQKQNQKLKRFGKNHFEFLADPKLDQRRELLESLLKIVNKYDSSIIVYNKTFEEQRLRELQKLFPDKHDEIDQVIERLFDLMNVVKNYRHFYQELGFSDEDVNQYNFYSPKQSGSYSLKKVIKAFSEEAYEDLPINSGDLAFKTFMRLPEMAYGERQQARRNLLDYCNQDTYSMYQIISGLQELIK